AQDLRAEVSNGQPEDAAFPPGSISPRRCPHPTVATDFDAADWCQPAPEVCVLAVEFDGPVEATNPGKRATPNGEVASVENRAKLEYVVNGELRGCRHHDVIHAGEEPTAPAPVVKRKRAGAAHPRGVLR